jgi:hypothetical protein
MTKVAEESYIVDVYARALFMCDCCWANKRIKR